MKGEERERRKGEGGGDNTPYIAASVTKNNLCVCVCLCVSVQFEQRTMYDECHLSGYLKGAAQ